MTYSPENKNSKPLFLTMLLTSIAVFCFMYSGNYPKYVWLMQLLFVVLGTTAIQIFLKYVLTTFEYTCDDESLYIYKAVGKRKVLIGKLGLENSASYIARKKSFNDSGDDYKIKSVYVYTRNFMTENAFVYVTTMGETNYMIKIEVNDEFAKYVNCKIDEILKGTNRNDEI